MNEKTILIVEDEASVVALMKAVIIKCGFSCRVLHASSISEVEMCLTQENWIDLIFWDNRIKEGYVVDHNLIMIAKKQYPHCAMVAMSSTEFVEQIAQGCNIDLRKVFTVEQLRKVLDQVLTGQSV